jgi:hypothetical protein
MHDAMLSAEADHRTRVLRYRSEMLRVAPPWRESGGWDEEGAPRPAIVRGVARLVRGGRALTAAIVGLIYPALRHQRLHGRREVAR